jgi:hypothetical protein
MAWLEHFVVLDDHAEFRPRGEMSLRQSTELITAAIELARQQGVRRLLVNAIEITGHGPGRLADRYFTIQEWGHAAGGAVRVAFVARPEFINPDKFGVTAGANVGLTLNVFSTEESALAWLLAG